MEHATLAKKVEQINGRENRFLSLHTDGDNLFGEHLLSFLCAIPAAGRYRVSIESMTGTAQGIVQLFQNEHAVGPPTDFYAETRDRSQLLPMGELELKEGPNQVFFKLMGKNAKSSGMAWDVVTLVLEKLP